MRTENFDEVGFAVSRVRRASSKTLLKILTSLALSATVVSLNRLQTGVGFLWGDDFLVVEHFRGADSLFSAIVSGLSETGQGKWRPLTYLFTSVFSYLFGTNFVWWTALSIVILASVLLSIWFLIEFLGGAVVEELSGSRVVFGSTIRTFSLGFVVWAATQPMFWYTFSSPFAIMELGALGCSIRMAHIFARSGREGLSDLEFAQSLVLGLAATLLHERYFVLLLGLCLFSGLRCIREACELRKSSQPLRSSDRLWRSVAGTWLSTFVAFYYLLLRVKIPNSELISSGGELGIESTFGKWVVLRPLIMLLRASFGGGQILHFESENHWMLPEGEDLDLVWMLEFLFILLIFAGALFFLRKVGKSQPSWTRQVNSFWPVLLPALGGCLVAERIEPRWWMGARLWLYLLVLMILLTVRVHGSKLLARVAAGVAAALLLVSSISSQGEFFRSPKLVSEVLETVHRERESLGIASNSIDQVVLIPPDVNSSSFAWSFGYGGVIRSHLGLDEDALISFGGDCVKEFCIKVPWNG